MSYPIPENDNVTISFPHKEYASNKIWVSDIKNNHKFDLFNLLVNNKSSSWMNYIHVINQNS